MCLTHVVTTSKAIVAAKDFFFFKLWNSGHDVLLKNAIQLLLIPNVTQSHPGFPSTGMWPDDDLPFRVPIWSIN